MPENEREGKRWRESGGESGGESERQSEDVPDGRSEEIKLIARFKWAEKALAISVCVNRGKKRQSKEWTNRLSRVDVVVSENKLAGLKLGLSRQNFRQAHELSISEVWPALSG